MSQKLKIAIVGAGHMGNYHARAVAARPDAVLASVLDIDRTRAAHVAAQYGSRVETDLGRLAAEADAVIIAAATSAHRDLALRLLEKGVAVLVEKPLAATAREAREIADAAARSGAVAQVGHTLRFDPVTRAIAGRPFVPHYIEVNWVAPFSFRGADVGVVMDLMIHGLDLVLDWAGRMPSSVEAVGGTVIGPCEDFANARLAFPGGCVATLTASRMSRTRQRLIRIFAEGAYLRLDYAARKAEVVTPGPKLAEVVRSRDTRTPPAMEDLVKAESLEVDATRDALRDQLASFIAAVRGDSPVAVPAEAGARAVEVAEEILRAIHAGGMNRDGK
jgi:predicted dehydrogenase